jgi:hypothetical protein
MLGAKAVIISNKVSFFKYYKICKICGQGSLTILGV